MIQSKWILLIEIKFFHHKITISIFRNFEERTIVLLFWTMSMQLKKYARLWLKLKLQEIVLIIWNIF